MPKGRRQRRALRPTRRSPTTRRPTINPLIIDRFRINRAVPICPLQPSLPRANALGEAIIRGMAAVHIEGMDHARPGGAVRGESLGNTPW